REDPRRPCPRAGCGDRGPASGGFGGGDPGTADATQAPLISGRRLQEEALSGAAELSADVGEHPRRPAPSDSLPPGLRRDTDPLSLWVALEVDAQVGVHERPAS